MTEELPEEEKVAGITFYGSVMTGIEALRMYQYSSCLTTFEKEELLYCNKVYFLGLEANK